MKTRRPFALNVLLCLLLFLSLGALFGGGVLTLDPSGELLQMPIIILKNSPFNNFLIPGLILFTVLGVIPALVFYSLLKRPQWTWVNVLNVYRDMYWAWTFTLYVGFALIIWISVQTLMINSVHFVHTGYVLLGISIVFIALLPPVRQHYFQSGQQ
ncbi:MAG: hypothetical protein KAT68_14840 [Bacteroidales bacterium]|nr:hypothetical protein [Bacteroidales bacterium]